MTAPHPVSRRRVGITGVLTQDARQPPEDGIALLMAVGVVDGFAVVDVEHDQPDRVVVSRPLLRLSACRAQSATYPPRRQRSPSRPSAGGPGLNSPATAWHLPPLGAIAQLGERLDRTQEVAGSSPASSMCKRSCKTRDLFLCPQVRRDRAGGRRGYQTGTCEAGNSVRISWTQGSRAGDPRTPRKIPSFETSGIPRRIAVAAIQRSAVCAFCDHHLIVRRQGTSAAQELLDWQLEVLVTVVRCMRRHASNTVRRTGVACLRRTSLPRVRSRI
jgi:hypothetical protein